MSPVATPLPRTLAWHDGVVTLWRLGAAAPAAPPVLLIPSLLHRWHVFDLVPHASLAAALVAEGLDVFALDWAEAHRDRFFDLEEALHRLARARRVASRLAGAAGVALVGYSQGGTLAVIDAALAAAGEVRALVNLAGPIDFARGGAMAGLSAPALCDADAIADAGGPPGAWFRALIAAQAPAEPLRDLLLRGLVPHPAERAVVAALDSWANDAVALSAEAFRGWIKAFYQDNALIGGRLRVAGRPVTLGRITVPVLVAVPDEDRVCPPASALALLDHVASPIRASLHLPGGHASGVAGLDAPGALHRPLATWLAQQLTPARAPAQPTLTLV